MITRRIVIEIEGCFPRYLERVLEPEDDAQKELDADMRYAAFEFPGRQIAGKIVIDEIG